jgi:NAD(P)-dependent dehydrogenase (short-subunit alcohol dehydrogenase family)
MGLKDQVVLVTGSTTGIGEAIAHRAAGEGARVMVHGTREDAAREVVEAIRAKGGVAAYVVASLEEAGSAGVIMGRVIAEWGRIDVVVNNAATVPRATLETTSVELFDRIIAVNLRAPFLLAQAALPHFRRQGGGRVLNIGSINAYCGEKNLCVYSASKGALTTLTRNLADAYGIEGIRVNMLSPGWVLTKNEYETQLREGMPEDWPERLPKGLTPGGRLLMPEEIAAAAMYLLSHEAGLVNGTVMEIEQYPMIGRNPPKGV